MHALPNITGTASVPLRTDLLCNEMAQEHDGLSAELLPQPALNNFQCYTGRLPFRLQEHIEQENATAQMAQRGERLYERQKLNKIQSTTKAQGEVIRYRE